MNPLNRFTLKRGPMPADPASRWHRPVRFFFTIVPAVLAVLAAGLPLSVSGGDEREPADAGSTAPPPGSVTGAAGRVDTVAGSATTVAPASYQIAAHVPVEHRTEVAGKESVEHPEVDASAAVEAAGAEHEVVAEPAPAPPPPAPDPCGGALAWVAEAGLPLPPGVAYHCPSTQFAHHGAACWDAAPCRRGPFIAINLELIGDRPTEYLRHVVAHEVCHILDFQAKGWTTEAGADACAAAHGAP